SNSPPILAPIGDKTINEGALLTFTNSGFDLDIPAQNLAFSLDPGAPTGASVGANNGVFTWIPAEDQGPGSYTLTIRLTDDGTPAASAAKTFTITVNESNTPPALAPIADRTVNEGDLLTFSISESDEDLPPQSLTYSLDAGSPAGAAINLTNGMFTWIPAADQCPEIDPLTFRFTDHASQ